MQALSLSCCGRWHAESGGLAKMLCLRMCLSAGMDPVNLMQLQQSWMAFECDSPELSIQAHPALVEVANKV